MWHVRARFRGEFSLDMGICHRVRRALYMAFLAALAIIVASPLAGAAPASEGEAIASRIWTKLLTRCGDSYFYAGSMFDGQGMLADVQVGHTNVIEFKGVTFHIVPIRVTD